MQTVKVWLSLIVMIPNKERKDHMFYANLSFIHFKKTVGLKYRASQIFFCMTTLYGRLNCLQLSTHRHKIFSFYECGCIKVNVC